MRSRWIVIVTLGLGVSLAASLGLVLHLDGNDQKREASQRTEALLSALATPVSLLLAPERTADIDVLMKDLSQNSERLALTSVVLVNGKGVVVAESSRGPNRRVGQSLAADAFVARALASPHVMHDPKPPARVSVPVPVGARWAVLVGTIDEHALQQALAARRERLVWSAVAVASLGLVVLLLLLSIEVLTPIAAIARMAERLAGGDLKARVAARGAAELRTLALTLNDAARKLAGTQEQLEAEVARRTEELQGANERLEKLSLTDPLTGLYNRRYLDRALALEVTRQRRHKRPFSLLMIDVDHFKQFNDCHGHPKGDAALTELARVIQASVRASDIVARVGGEELVAVLIDVELPDAATAAENVRTAVEKVGQVTVSIGLACWPKHGATPSEVIEAADKALYVSKHEGRNRVTGAV